MYFSKYDTLCKPECVIYKYNKDNSMFNTDIYLHWNHSNNCQSVKLVENQLFALKKSIFKHFQYFSIVQNVCFNLFLHLYLNQMFGYSTSKHRSTPNNITKLYIILEQSIYEVLIFWICFWGMIKSLPSVVPFWVSLLQNLKYNEKYGDNILLCSRLTIL